MKKLKRIIALVLATICCSTAFSACGGFIKDNGDMSKIDATKTQLYIGCYAGGYGRAWLDAAIKRFEAQYADVSFETGKTGVQVRVDYQKSYANISQSNMDGMTQSVIFSEQCYFNDYIINGKFLDISDIVTESLSDITSGKETGSIENKLTEAQQNAYKAYDGKYYCLPHYEAFGGLSIDVDIWKENNLYVSSTKVGATHDDYGCITDEYGEKSLGPDGQTGVKNGVDYSVDDGLPATYEELFNVCRKMISCGITPFIWTGGFPEYINLLPTALYADGAGAEAFSITFDFDSNGQEIEYYDANMNKQKAVITEQNAYLMKQQVAKYDSIDFINTLTKNPNWISSFATSGAVNHEDAQAYFVEGNGTEKFGFLVEGNYWYNEAKGVFDDMVKDKADESYSADNRNFQWIPLPRATAIDADDYKITAVDRNYSCAFINANVKGDKVAEKLSKLFLKFCYTKESLIEFTVESGATKGVDYQLTEAEESEMLSKLNPYEKSFWNYRSKANILYPISDSKIFLNAQQSFNLIDSDWTITVGSAKYVTPYEAIKASVSATDYFKAGWISESTWTTNYSKYFN